MLLKITLASVSARKLHSIKTIYSIPLSSTDLLMKAKITNTTSKLETVSDPHGIEIDCPC